MGKTEGELHGNGCGSQATRTQDKQPRLGLSLLQLALCPIIVPVGAMEALNQGLSTPVGIKLSFRCGPTRSYHVTLHILYFNDLCHWQGGSLANRCAPPCSPTSVTQTSPFFPSIGKAQFLQFPLWELVPAQNMQHPIGDLELILRSL